MSRTETNAHPGSGKLRASNQENRELLARLKLTEGDKLYVVEQTERGMKLSPYDPKHAKAMELARRSFRKYADTCKALAR
jgi:hypothetical protein